MPSSFSLRQLSISVVEQQEVIAGEQPWYSNIKFMAGNVPYDIDIKPGGMQVKNGYSINKKPRQLGLKFAPKLLVGLVSASADANNHPIWNQDELKEIEETDEADPEEILEQIKDFVGSLADIEGGWISNIQTPVLVNESGAGMQVNLTQNCNDRVSTSDLRIDMATDNPLGILVYSFRGCKLF